MNPKDYPSIPEHWTMPEIPWSDINLSTLGQALINYYVEVIVT